MNKITIEEIRRATEGQLASGNGNAFITGVSTDSRKVCEDDVFFPIVGEVHDAHKFIPKVVDSGCKTYVISDSSWIEKLKGFNVIVVADTTVAIQKLAKYYLEKLNLKKVAVTGSVGKTSTRDMVYHVLKEKYHTGKTVGNYNNDIGVPLTIFSFEDTMEAAVLEVGMDHSGEINRLCEIIRPNIGIITNVGVSHIENLGSREAILQAKMEITDFFGAENSLVINKSNDLLSKVSDQQEYQLISVGTDPGMDFYVHDVVDNGENGIEYKLTIKGREYSVKLYIPGEHNGINSALAIAAGSSLGVTIEQAIEGLKKLELTGKRLTIREAGGINVIDDTYNAAPDSMKSAIKTLINTNGKRKIAILGDMNELGTDSAKFHKDVGIFAGEQGVDMVIAVGEKSVAIYEGALQIMDKDKVFHFNTKDELYKKMDGMFLNGDVIVVKASRALEMENVVERIIKG